MKLNRVVTAAVPVEAKPKSGDAYQWFTYTGKPLDLMSGVGTPLYLKKGQVFGVRKSSNGKQIRMITQELGPNKVFTLLPEVALSLGKHCTKTEPVTAAASKEDRLKKLNDQLLVQRKKLNTRAQSPQEKDRKLSFVSRQAINQKIAEIQQKIDELKAED